MKVVKFVKPYSPYAVGDVCGLPDKEARAAIKAGKAVPYKEEKEEKSVDEAPVDKMIKTAPNKK